MAQSTITFHISASIDYEVFYIRELDNTNLARIYAEVSMSNAIVPSVSPLIMTEILP